MKEGFQRKRYLQFRQFKTRIRRQRVAQEQMIRLDQLAEQEDSYLLRKRYYALISAIGMKAKEPVPAGVRRKFCKKCLAKFHGSPELVSRTRIRSSHGRTILVTTCLSCNAIYRQRIEKPRMIDQAKKGKEIS